jgi:hypothetical protein
MKWAGLVVGWLISLALFGYGALLWRDYLHNVSTGFDVWVPPGSSGEAEEAVARLTWAPATAAIVLGAFLNPTILKWVPGLRTYWVRALVGFAIAGGLIGYAVYVGMLAPL